MSEEKTIRLSTVIKDLNVGKEQVFAYLKNVDTEVGNNPNAKISSSTRALLIKEFSADAALKAEAHSILNRDSAYAQDAKAAGKKGGQIAAEVDIKPRATDTVKKVELAGASAPKASAAVEDTIKASASAAEVEEKPALKVLGKIDLSAPRGIPQGPPINKKKEEEAPLPAAAEIAPVQKEASNEATKSIEETPKTIEEPKAKTAVAEKQELEPVVATPQASIESPKVEAPKMEAPKVEISAPATAEPTAAPAKVESPKEVTIEKTAPVSEPIAAKVEEKTEPVKAEMAAPAIAEVKATPAMEQPKASVSPAEEPKVEKVQEATTAPTSNAAKVEDKTKEQSAHKGEERRRDNKQQYSNDRPKSEAPRAEAAKPNAPKYSAEKIEPAKEENNTPPVDDSVIEAKADALKGLTVLGKVDLSTFQTNKPKQGGGKPGQGGNNNNNDKRKRERKRVKTGAIPVAGTTAAGAVKINEDPKGKSQGGNQGNNNQGGGNRNNQQGGGGNRNQGNNNNRGGGQGGNNNSNSNNNNNRDNKPQVSGKQVQENIKNTLNKMGGGKSGIAAGRKHRKDRRNQAANERDRMLANEQEESKTLKVTEYISASDLASLMDVSVNEVISTCLSMGMFVSINQRLDAEVITIIADEFGFDVQFITADEENDGPLEEEDNEDSLVGRAPIVTIMGHVDHGKTSLLDYIRKTKVVAGEAGGITQHIGAYDVMTESGKRITFLDTPGHEAFTAMRARGAKVTDVVIIVVAADDQVMPQTKEAINHAQVAGVPIVIAINKIDKPAANPEKVKEQLAGLNILVEDWGGKYQCQHISAKQGTGINELLEKVLLEAELLELKANPVKRAVGTVIEASLDKGRGYVSTLLVQAGTLKVGDMMLVGAHYGKVKAMTNHLGQKLESAGPSIPVQVLGLNGAPQAGDKFNVTETEKEAKEIANRRVQIQREQSIRTKKHLTLDDIGRRLAIGNFKELNIIIKGDVDGSVEALSDSLLKLSTEEIQVRILHKGVGQISESDVLLASASDAIIIGFQVRPSSNARKIAENEEIEIRLYSIIYDAINDIKAAMEGMLEPDTEEVIVGTIDVREVFKISKIGTVAGCYVTDGYVKRNNAIRLIREGIVVTTGEISALKRFKDDVSEVKYGYECGLSIKNWNDIQLGDTIESFEIREIKKKLT